MEFIHLPPPRSCLLALLLPLPALTLNSLGTVSFGVARPRKASRPQPSRMARTEEKSLSTLRTWPHSGHSVRSGLPSPRPIHGQGPRPRPSPLPQKELTLTADGKKRLVLTCLKAMASRKEARKRRREKKAMSGTV